MRQIYRPLFLNETPILFTGAATAELIKYAANAFLATKITFINEMADICEKTGADVQDVARGIGLDSRIGPKFLHPGRASAARASRRTRWRWCARRSSSARRPRIVETVMEVNDARKLRMAERIVEACGGSSRARRSACWAWPSSRTPTTCARRRRSTSCRG